MYGLGQSHKTAINLLPGAENKKNLRVEAKVELRKNTPALMHLKNDQPEHHRSSQGHPLEAGIGTSH